MVAVPLNLNLTISENKRSHFEHASEKRAGPVLSVVIVLSPKPDNAACFYTFYTFHRVTYFPLSTLPTARRVHFFCSRRFRSRDLLHVSTRPQHFDFFPGLRFRFVIHDKLVMVLHQS